MERKEALEVVRKNMPTDRSLPVYEALQTLIPELAESEDERIRKWIASYIHHGVFTEDEHPMALKAVEWLEKQKEQKHYWKPTETDVALFNKAVTTNKALTPTERAQLDIIRSKFGCCRAVNCSGIDQKEQKPADRFEEAREKYRVEWSEEDEAAYDAFMCEVVNEKMNPTIEQVKWLRGIRDRFKSLRPSWKPSEEQVEALRNAVHKLAKSDVADSVRLSIMYDNLKKLM